MSTIKSSAENLTLNADGANNDIKFQSNGSEVASIDQAGLVTATTFAGSGASLTAIPAANLTGTLPAIDGSNLTGVSGGKVLQVVMGSSSTAKISSSATYQDTGLSAAITPSASGSKVLVIVNHTGAEKDAGNVYTNQRLKLLRGSTEILETSDHILTGVNAAAYFDGPNMAYLDSPSTTSATTYKTTFRSSSGYGNTYVMLGGTSTIILMEISA